MRKNILIFKTTKDLQEHYENDTIYLEKNSTLFIHASCAIQRNIYFSGKNIVKDCNKISNNCKLHNVIIGSSNLIKFSSYIANTEIKNLNTIGPFSYIRDKTFIGSKNIIGAHSELTRSTLRDNNKLSHFSFVGDTNMGKNNIIGAGVVTANYKSSKKSKLQTKIKNNCLIGSNSTLIAPCLINSGSIIGAGSIINFDVKKNQKIVQKRFNKEY